MERKSIIMEIIPVSALRHGDTVLTHDISVSEDEENILSKATTVNQKYLKNGFYGFAFQGLLYRNGIKRILFPKWEKGKFAGYVTQR
jgi:predicted transcriptional regulator